MSLVRPFAALRPRPEFAARIAAVPYDVVNTAEARALASDPLSFLHVSRAEIDLPAATDPYADAVYARAVEAFGALRQSNLEQEAQPAVYVYRLRMGEHQQTGVAACFSVDEYRCDLVKKHEKTRPDKENDRTRHIIETRAQSGPVLLTYRGTGAIDEAVSRAVAGPPLYAFTAPDGIAHTIWRADPAVAEAIVRGFAEVPALYIADGHHRAASAARADQHLAAGRAQAVGQGSAATGDAQPRESAWFLAVAFPAAQTQILPYHRVVKDLVGRTPDMFLEELTARLPVAEGGPGAARKGQCAMYLAGRWHTLTLDARPAADPVASLDVQRLQDTVLAPLLAIGDPRTDKRIDFVGGIRGPAELVRLVDGGAAEVAFAMYPTTIDELIAIADAGGIMPPKSTWFEPKLRDGLLTHLI
jgi:uncharacterized protein (DUF1015 family)